MESEKSKGAVTVNVNVVVCDKAPAAPVTVIVDSPAGVDAVVARVTVGEQAALHDAGKKVAVAPTGKPDAEKDTDCAVPETSVSVMVVDADSP